MLDPITSLAFSMQSAKGVYALLLGSGVSRSAKIPTGWEITLELVRKIAVAQGAGNLPGNTAAVWYRETFGKEPDYAQLLDGLAKTPSERQQVLRHYIEPDDAERSRGDKLPTPAHRAIARLIAAGYVRVVITTNFDPLLEDALREQGVAPTVISSAHAEAGAVPLVHAGCTIIKVHGDYLDTRIRNTPAELAEYEPQIDRLLDRVVDEFGLIVCGWSADWDPALRAAIERAPSRRYSMYWAARGEPSSIASSLIARRAGVRVSIGGADEFFDELAQKVCALQAFNAPHPLSAELAVATLKEYLANPRDRIRLDDLICAELQRVVEALDSPHFSADGPSDINHLVPRYEAAVTTLAAMAMTAGRWSIGGQVDVWVDAIRTLGARARDRGLEPLGHDLALIPASLVLHAYGLGAVVGRHYSELGRLTTLSVDFDLDRGPVAAGDRLNAGSLMREGQARLNYLLGYQHQRHPLSDHIADALRLLTKPTVRDETTFEHAFLTVEMVLALGYAERISRGQEAIRFLVPPGRYCENSFVRAEILEAWRDEGRSPRSWGSSSVSKMAGLVKPPELDAIASLTWYASTLGPA